MRIPEDAPCLADPDAFDCNGCSIGWVAKCALRDDESRRYFEAASRKLHGGALLDQLQDAATIQMAAVDIAKGQGGVSITAPLVAERLGKTRSEPSLHHIGFVLRSSEAFRETTPGYFA